jgi:CheY-like chemotaxis protein
MNPVDRSLRILHLEDSRADAELVEFTLEREGVHFSITRVESRSDFIDTLNKGGIDLIISDFTLPAFNGSHALEIARELSPEIPYIFVSGTIGEEAAIDGMRQGATDYGDPARGPGSRGAEEAEGSRRGDAPAEGLLPAVI